MNEKPIVADLQWQTMCLYGESGVGKTTVGVTAPKPYVLDSNDGLLSVANKPGLEHVRGDKVTKIADLDDVYAKATGTHGSKDWRKKYQSYLYDHFDDIQGIIMDELGERALVKDDRRDVDEWQQKEYGIMYNRLARHLRKWKRVPAHKILICGATSDFDTGVLRPSLIGAMKTKLSYFCDHIVYVRVGKKGSRWMHLDPTDEFYAKTRAWWLPKELRTLRIERDDTTFLTRFFEEVRKGPQATRSARKPSTTKPSTTKQSTKSTTKE
jgi:ABC-type oligopeptide transport system ATPase subunit